MLSSWGDDVEASVRDSADHVGGDVLDREDLPR
jgi:hypothetical protein